MSELGVFIYCAAVGFVTAATLSSFYQLLTAQKVDFSFARGSIPGMAVAIVLSMFAGPFIIMQRVVTGLRSREISVLPAAIGAVLAGMWSVCAGIFYVSLAISA